MSQALHIAYMGPGLSGKTSSMRQLAQRFECDPSQISHHQPHRGQGELELLILSHQHHAATSLHMDIHVHTLTGNHMPERTQNQKLLGCMHGVIFVADAQPIRHEANLLFLNNLLSDLKHIDKLLNHMVIVGHLNKVDVSSTKSMAHMSALLKLSSKAPWFESVATDSTHPGAHHAFLACVSKAREVTRLPHLL